MRTNPPIEIALQGDERRTVEAEYIGKHWGVHRNLPGVQELAPKTWTITHRPSGLAAYKNAPNKKAARIYAESIAELVDLEDADDTIRALGAIDILNLHAKLAEQPSAAGWKKSIDAWIKGQGGIKKAKKRVLVEIKPPSPKRRKKTPSKKRKPKKKAKRGKKRNPEFNPIPGMPGGSVRGCIALQEAKPKAQRPRDSGAYCAAIADRIEPGWRERNPREQLGLFGEKQTEVEGFALVSPRGRPVEPVRPPKGTQERILPAEKPSREAIEEQRRRELAERAERRKRKENPVGTLKRRLLTR